MRWHRHGVDGGSQHAHLISLTIEQGAVAPWNSLMWSLMVDVCREMGVRTDVPFQELSKKEKQIVYDGPAEKKHILYKPKSLIRPLSWILRISMRCIRWRMRWPK